MEHELNCSMPYTISMRPNARVFGVTKSTFSYPDPTISLMNRRARWVRERLNVLQEIEETTINTIHSTNFRSRNAVENALWPALLTSIQDWRFQSRVACPFIIFLFIQFSGTSANAGPHYQKLYTRVAHVWGNRKGQPNRSAMEEPRPGGTTFMIAVTLCVR